MINKFSNWSFKKINITTLIFLCLAFFTIRLIVIFQNSAGYDFQDSDSYFKFTLSRPIRMPLITLVFSEIEYYGALSLIQVSISSLAWIALAISISKFLPSFKLLGFFLILVLGISSPVVELDSLVLSESFTLSALIFALATFFLYLNNPNTKFALTHIFFIFLFSQLKQSTLVLGSIWILVFLLIFYLTINVSKYLVYVISLLLLMINILIWNLVSENVIHDRQLSSTLIIEKSFFSSELREYWLNQGFPPDAYLIYGGPPFDIPIQAVRNLHSIKSWENQTESNPSFRLIRDNPFFALLAPLFPKTYIENYGYLNSILPALASGTNYAVDQDFRDGRFPEQSSPWIYDWPLPKTIYWNESFNSQKYFLIFLFGNFILFSLIRKNYFNNFDKQRLAINLILLFFLGSIWVNWLVTAYGYTRYLMPYSVGLRVILIIVFLFNIAYFWKVKSISQAK